MATELPDHYTEDYVCVLYVLPTYHPRIGRRQIEGYQVPFLTDALSMLDRRNSEINIDYYFTWLRLTLEVYVGGPIPLDMGNYPFPTTMQTGIVSYADASAGGVEVVKCRWQRGERRRAALLTDLFDGSWGRRLMVACVRVGIRVLDQGH